MGLEIISVVDAVSETKDMDREIIFEAIENALESATKKKYDYNLDVKVKIDRLTGDYETYRRWMVFADESRDLEDPDIELRMIDAIDINKDAQPGEYVEEAIESVDFDRIGAQIAKQVIVQKVREAEKQKTIEQYKDKVGEVISGVVKRMDRNGFYVDIGNNAEAFLPRKEMIPKEALRPQDRIKSILKAINDDLKGPPLLLSRVMPEFLIELFKVEVPEITQNLITIEGASRDPGLRAKIAVHSEDKKIDAVGACVGMRGSRVQAVVNELQGEKIDIVNWSEDPAIVVSNALSPAEVQRVNVDSVAKKLDVILTEENLSKAIGRRGQNVRLATKLLNYEINIMTDAEDSERRQSEFKEKTENFVKNLELDETLGQLLVAEGFSSISDIKDSSPENLMKIEGIEEDTAKALIERAKEFYQKDQEDITQRIKDLGLQDDLINHKGLTPGMLVTLGEQKILKLEDFADLASDELTGDYDIVKGERIKIQGYLEDFALSKTEADELIMSARNIIYKV